MSGIPTIRIANLEDAELLTGLARQTFQETFGAQTHPQDLALYLQQSFHPRQQQQELADPLTITLLVEVAEQTVGYAQLRVADTPACIQGNHPLEIGRIYLLQAWVGRGLGNLLMKTCLEAAQMSGFQTVWLGVWEHNYLAQAFYEKWGFCKVGEHIFPVGNDPQVDWLMQRSLEPVIHS
ncbi:MAG: GNAT family N-acetyltransferase [Cyanobacteriota bacterium]|nr:GNAT family N-acetyltransferase [Cyanobacteriota bacterium]